MATGDTAKAGQTQQVDRRKESQPAAVREPNRRAGRHRPPTRQVLTEANCGTDAASRSRPATVIARASPWPRVQWLPLSGRGRHGRGWRRRDRDSAFCAKRSSRVALDRSALPMHRAQNCHDVAGCRISGEPAVFVRIPSELPRRTGGSLAFVRSVSVGCD